MSEAQPKAWQRIDAAPLGPWLAGDGMGWVAAAALAGAGLAAATGVGWTRRQAGHATPPSATAAPGLPGSPNRSASPDPSAHRWSWTVLTWAFLAAALTLVISYHRHYDAVLLVVAGAWAWRAWHRGQRLAAGAVAAALAVLAVPGPAALSHTWGMDLTLGAPLLQRLALLHHNLVLLVLLAVATGATVRCGLPQRSRGTLAD